MSKQITHVEVPLKEEYVVSEVRCRLDDEAPEYRGKLRELMKTIEDGDWTETKKREFKEYHKHLGMLKVKDKMFFYNQSRFVPERRLIGKILNRDHGLHVGITKIKAKIA